MQFRLERNVRPPLRRQKCRVIPDILVTGGEKYAPAWGKAQIGNNGWRVRYQVVDV